LYSHCNTTYLPNDIALLYTHFFIIPIPKNEPLVINVDKNYHTSLNILKNKQAINKPKLINDHQEVLQPKITPTPYEK